MKYSFLKQDLHQQQQQHTFIDLLVLVVLYWLTVLVCTVSCRPGEGAGGGARAVAETVQHFITAMDSLKLNLVAVDQVSAYSIVYILAAEAPAAHR